MAKRRLKKNVKIIFVLIFISIAGICAYIFKKPEESKAVVATKVMEKVKKEVFKPKETTLTLAATGDSMLHNSVYLDAYNRENDSFDFTNQIKLIKDYVKDFDLVYYNQESVFGDRQPANFRESGSTNVLGYGSYPYFNSPSEFGDAMVDAGFNLVSLASNHSCDCTTLTDTCVKNSYNYWKSKDIVFDGFDTKEDEPSYIIKEKNDISYTLLNYTVDLNGLGNYNSSGYIQLYDKEKVKEDILSVRDKVDVLIVAMHWHNGPEYSFTPAEKNIEIANYLSDLGVDIILGTYSHCVQPFDIINDKTVVFYSLGNFISNQGVLTDSIGYKGIVGMLGTLNITKTVDKEGNKSIKINNIGAELLYTYSKIPAKGLPHDFMVIPFSQMTSEYNNNYLDIYNEYSQVVTSLNKNISIVPVNE